jgi:drug/metabolite transporter (DMT)-like permease
MTKKHFGSFAVILAAVLWSLDGLLRRQLYTVPATVIVFWEHLVGLIVLAPFVIATWRKFGQLTKKQWIAIVGVSFLSGALGTILYTTALAKIQYIPFSVVVLLQQLQPVFAVLAAAILLKEPITRRFILLGIIALAAAYGVSFPDLKVNLATGAGTAIAALCAVGAAACWGSSTAFSKYTLKDTSSLHVTALRFAITPLFALLMMAMLGHTGSIGAISTTQWWYILAITFSTGMVALALYYFGLKRILASRSTILELTWPLSAVVISIFALHETLSVTQWISAAVLLAAIVAITRMNATYRSPEI